MSEYKPLTLEERTAIRKRIQEADRRGINMDSACGEYNCACHYDVPRLLSDLEAVEAERDRYKAALEAVKGHDPETCSGISPTDCLDTVQEIARAALEGK